MEGMEGTEGRIGKRVGGRRGRKGGWGAEAVHAQPKKCPFHWRATISPQHDLAWMNLG